MTVNLRGTFRTLRAVYRAMKDTDGGRIVTLTSSASGLSGAFGQAAYATTKMGVLVSRGRWLGKDPFGIKVNALAPAAFDTRLFEVFTPDRRCGVTRSTTRTRDLLGFSEYVALLTASRVTPMALALGTPQLSCDPLRFSAPTGGYYCRYRRFSHTRGRDVRTASDRRGHLGNWGPYPRSVTGQRTRRRGDGMGREGVFHASGKRWQPSCRRGS